MVTLFSILTMDDAPQIYRPLIMEVPELTLYFLLAILAILVNLVTAVIVQSSFDMAQPDTEVKKAYEQHMMQSRAVPMVLLVVQGGPGTLATVLANAQLGCPVVLLSNSGGAASA